MDFEKKFHAGNRLILGMLVIVSLTATVLMERMSSAIKLILSENVDSIDAALDMTNSLTLHSITPLDLYRQQFLDALSKAKNKTTLKGEDVIINRIEELAPIAFSGTERAKRQLVEELEALVELNRGAMIKANDDAGFFAIAGGWAIVGFALLGLLLSAGIITQVQKQAIEPMVEICRGLKEWDQGNRLRRIQVSKGSKDIRGAQETLNQILDRLY